MEKTIINVPAGTKYLSELNGKLLKNGLPNGIFNKVVCDCGATTMALTDKNKTIICSPRVRLLENKHEQYSETLVVKKGVSAEDVAEYIFSNDVPKILTTYDSLSRVAKMIPDKENWRVVVDEFHFLLRDSGFKSETEFKTLECLTGFPYVTYLSATPMLDSFLEQIEQFKDIPYVELKWEDTRTVSVKRIKTPNPIDAALAIVKSYMNRSFPKIEIDSGIVESKECAIFLNSVTNIVNIIKKSGLKSDDVNIIVADTDENIRMIHKLGDGFEIGKIPLKGERHKLVTFCTSTAYAGCDFYSTCAATFVTCDSRRKNTAVDIGTELKQIAGRQRLACNPFRNVIHFIYNTNILDVSELDFKRKIFGKCGLTEKKVELFNNLPIEERNMQKKETQRIQKSQDFGVDYTMYDEATDKFMFNRMAYLYEQYAYELQKTYQDGITIRKQLEDNDFALQGNQEYISKFNEQVGCMIKRQPFTEKMKEYCEQKNNPFTFSASIIEKNNPEMKTYYDVLGAERIKALGYKECALKNEMRLREADKSIRILLSQIFYEGVRMTTPEIKTILTNVYEQCGIKKKGVARDLEKFGYKIKSVKIVLSDGTRKNGFCIV